MKLLSKFVFAVALVAAPAAFAAAFEGKVQMKMTDQRGSSHEISYRVKEGLVRTDIDTGRGQTASVIMDLGKQEMIILIPGKNMYLVRPLTDVSTVARKVSDENEHSFEKTDATEKILGYDCVKYISKSKDATTDIWVTDQLGQFMGLGGGGGPMGAGRRAEPPHTAWEKALAGKNFFPLRVVSHDRKGAENFRLETISVEKEAQPASVFAPPEGAQKFDLPGMMQGLGFPKREP